MSKAVVKLVLLSLLCWLPQTYAAIVVNAARVWPAQEYTRLTLESNQAIRYNMFTVDNPQRLVVDLEDVELGAALNQLTGLITSEDPYIRSVRVGQFKPDIVRLVLDLKNDVKPQLFELKPVGDYGYRLVLDVYPAQPVDPLLALLKQLDTATPRPSTGAAPPPTAPEPPDELMQLLQQRATNKDKQPSPSSGNTARIPDASPGQTGSIGQASRDGKLRRRTMIVAIDAGHGGEDPGATGRYGSREKDVTLAIARKVKALIDQIPNVRGVLIRDGDYFIPLGTRVARARKLNADLFISIHADAYLRPDARGSSVFALSEHGATSAAARWLAKKENDADLIGGVNIAVKDPYLARTLLDLSQTATINDSMKLAQHVLRELGNINDLHRGHIEQAGFAVLKAPDIPSILVETAFISNPVEERRLTNPRYQMKYANAILRGIERYCAQNPALATPKIAQVN